MSLKTNILANYAGQFYVTSIGIVLAPIYLHYMGSEVYGLIGFYVVLQVWFQLLDMGLTHAVAREVASYRGGGVKAAELLTNFSIIEKFFCVTGIFGAAIFTGASSLISTYWINSESLPLEVIDTSIALMIWTISLRWVGGVYRGVINGSEKIVWLNGFNVIFATLRFVFVIPVIVFLSAGPESFFLVQLLLAGIETVFLKRKARDALPPVLLGPEVKRKATYSSMGVLLKFSFTLAATNVFSILTMQTDKIILSSTLSLSAYGHFSLAVLMASGIILMSAPVISAILPRMSVLAAQGMDCSIGVLYLNAAKIITLTSVTSSLFLAIFSHQLLFAWTGDRGVSDDIYLVSACYAVGNGMASLRSLSFSIQYSRGRLGLYFLETVLFLIVLIFALTVLTKAWGINGAGYAWLAVQSSFFLFWIPVVHFYFLRGFHFSWMVNGVGKILVVAMCVIGAEWILVNTLFKWPEGRFALSGFLLIYFVSALLITALVARLFDKNMSIDSLG